MATVGSLSTHLTNCMLCEHRCGVNRSQGETGKCHAGSVARVFRHRIEYGEEPELIPSHLFYLSGCDLRCKFCIAEANAFNPSSGTELTADFFRQKVQWGREQGARNVQWVGGEPTIHLPAIIDVMSEAGELPPIVWKSDFHFVPEVFDYLDDWVDVYVADFKFGNDVCAKRIGGVSNYTSILLRNLKFAQESSRLIVRHLLLPNHFDCCFKPIVQLLQETIPDVRFSLRGGYLPKWQASHYSDLNAMVPTAHFLQAEQYAAAHKLQLIH